ncbi:hypothetical protein [Virgibacillus ihumii]|uniref:hypothetical protein n=1 Tax=Virgibacillus ihumii TaxID=2686091 RepID=UPI00157E26DC|nr:hypothetical protein [Virgibacillus ihumii]
MYWETLPNWFWILNYLFLLITLVAAIYSVVKKIIDGLSIVAIVFTVTVPVIGLLNSLGRTEGMDELEYLVNQLQQGSVWSIVVIIGYLYLLIWWFLFLFKSKPKKGSY